jgi:site-specific DNA recombinase
MTTPTKYAAIYVRTSSEAQAEKASPDEQERDCRRVATEHGLTVVEVYRDISKYRVKGKLVEPSGTRSDRPGLSTMLRDAAAGNFSVILAWREDRLYRGMRAMLNVLETIQEHKIEVILARETFDAKIAPLKAWVAGMELEGMKERMTMGVKARLRAGKANTGQDRFGYRRVGEKIEVVEEEAYWVRQIFAWYNERVRINEIRRRLIAANVPQKGASKPAKIQWSRPVIQGILKAASEYTTGIKIQTRLGEAFEIITPSILDVATYERFLEVRQANKTHPVNNQKNDYLIGGLLYCSCNRKWSANTRGVRTKGVLRKTPLGVYRCPEMHHEQVHPDCPRTIGSQKADALAWAKLVEAVNKPDVLIASTREYIDDLRAKAEATLADTERIQRELDGITESRQWVIRMARTQKITDEDMDHQLAELDLQELHLRKELTACQTIIDISDLNDWEAHARQFLEEVRAGIASLNDSPQTEEERRQIYEIKRMWVEQLVKRIEIDKDRNLTVTMQLDVLNFIQQTMPNESVGICSRTRWLRDRHCSAARVSPSPPAYRSSLPADRHQSVAR